MLKALLLGAGTCLLMAMSATQPLMAAESVEAPQSPEHSAEPSPEPEAAPENYSRTGADTCLKCHDETSAFPVMAIFKTPHGLKSDPRTPMAGLQCEACHGPSARHTARIRGDEVRPPPPLFGTHSTASTDEKNQVCLDCHQGDTRRHWAGSEHDNAEIGCVSCHRVHVVKDPVLIPGQEMAVCTSCHLQQHADAMLPSSHPLRSGEMSCSDCHSPHGSVQSSLLKGNTPSAACMDCHADKRGPYLWEHAPATEDCSLCHRPHGSNHPALLTQRTPWLCQQCHAQDSHPSLANTPAGAPSNILSLRSCTNCHSQVHGSNHPSGAALMR
jgi:DmsE family decaheme c-type cytochrome